jgi:hypothetical protein
MWKFGLWPCNSFSGNFFFEFTVLVLCSVVYTVHISAFERLKVTVFSSTLKNYFSIFLFILNFLRMQLPSAR